MKYIVLLLGTITFATRASAGGNPECMDRWQRATDAGIVYGVGIVAGIPTLEVDERIFLTIPFDAKEDIVETLNCAIFSDGSNLGSVEIISYSSRKRLVRAAVQNSTTVAAG